MAPLEIYFFLSVFLIFYNDYALFLWLKMGTLHLKKKALYIKSGKKWEVGKEENPKWQGYPCFESYFFSNINKYIDAA